MFTIILVVKPDSLVFGSECSFAEFQLNFFTYFNEKNFTVSLQFDSLYFGVTLFVFVVALGLILEIKSLFETSVDEFKNIVQVVFTNEDH